ncbi:MAG: long-chain fatty acid--CoA ligase, partial [Bacteroidota bacterium]
MRLFDFLYNQQRENPLQDALAYKIKDEWKKYSTADTIKIVNQLSQGLIAIGIKQGENVALIAEGRPEWVFVDLACQQIGAVLVPLYPTLSTAEYEVILKETEVKHLFVSNAKTLKGAWPACKKLGVTEIYTFSKIKNFSPWIDILKKGKSIDAALLKARKEAVKEEDVCTIIYTSGTSGRPKGVMLTHANISSNVLASSEHVSLIPGQDRALSFLPLNHIYEKTGIYIYIGFGIGIYFAESLDTIGDNLKEVKPHTFNTVPRLLEKVYDRILKTGSELSTIKKGIFNRAITLGLKYDPNLDQGAFYNRQLAVANKLVFKKWREALGGNIKQIQCGASALQPRLSRIFWAAGIKVLEGYGLTETSPVIAANQINHNRVGTVGKIYDNLDVRFGVEDEILVKGPSVMKGYYKNPELTKEVFTEDGYFRTGDVGKMEGQFLKITDRKKELFKTSGGLYIAPQQIENKLKESKYIEQAMVVGEGEKFPAVLIVPDSEEMMQLVNGAFDLIDTGSLRKHPKVKKVYQDVLNEVNEELGNWAKIKEFRFVAKPWTPETGELTPTMKLKRRVILEKCKPYIDSIYKQGEGNSFGDFEHLNIEEMSLEELEKYEEI